MTAFARCPSRRVLAAAIAVAALLAAGTPARATGDYTLPYHDPAIDLSYGVDRDPRVGIQLDYTGRTWYDSEPHPGRVYDNHTGLDYPMSVYTKVAAAKNGVVADTEGGYGTRQFGDFGNFVRVRHPDGRHTLYYHLASRADGGIAVTYDEDVIAGQKVGLSGCSGICFGPHLHFEVLVNSRFVDPLTIQVPRERQLTGRQLADFQKERARIDELMRRSPVMTASK